MKSEIGKNTVRTFLFSALGSAVGILTGIFLAKTLGPSGKGLFTGVQVLQGGITAITGGVGAAITYMLTSQKRTIGHLIAPLSLLLAVVTLLAWLFLLAWGLHFGFSGTLLIAAAVVPASILLSWRSNFYVGLGQVKNLNYQGFGTTLFILLTVIIAVQILHKGALGAIAAWAVCNYAAASIVLAHAIKLAQREDALNFWRDVKILFRYGSRAALDGLIGFLNYRIDSLVLIAFLGVSGFGIYSIAVAGGELLFMISRAVNLAAAHDIASLDLAASAALTAKSIRTSTFVLAVLALILGLAGPAIITTVYGPRFQSAGTSLRILLPGVVAYAASGSFASFFGYRLGQPMFLVYLGAIMIAIQFGVSVVLIPRMGLAGAAIGSTVTYLFATVVATFFFRRVAAIDTKKIWLVQAEDLRTLGRVLRGLLFAPAPVD